jgi:hypothetical protein
MKIAAAAAAPVSHVDGSGTGVKPLISAKDGYSPVGSETAEEPGVGWRKTADDGGFGGSGWDSWPAK